MPRSARTELAGGIHHITARGNSKQAVFLDQVDHLIFTRLLRRVIERYGWRCLTFCLLRNHYHLLVLTPEPTLGRGMHRLNGLYAQHFNRRHKRIGHVWGSRYFSKPLLADAHLHLAMRYIALNPVRAGLCATPEHWEWSAHRALLGLAAPGFVDVATALSYFGANGADGRTAYRAFVADGT
jgi:putative transposase